MEISDDGVSNTNTTITNIKSSDISYVKSKNRKWILSDSDSDFSNLLEISETEIDDNSHSLNKEKKNNSNEENDETACETKQSKNSYTFTWNENGEEIKITGSFSNWKEQYTLKKDPIDNIFKLTLKLNDGKYEYKFIVDGIWKCAEGQPKIIDENGNINNIVEIGSSDFIKENKIKNPKKKNVKNKKYKNDNNEKNKLKKLNKKKYKKNDEGYDNVYPDKEEEANTGMTLPNKNYRGFFNLDNYTRQKKVSSNKLYLKYQKQENYSASKSYGLLFDLGHINLNHLFLVKNKDDNKNKNINRIGINYKFRFKTSTFIYYNNKN